MMNCLLGYLSSYKRYVFLTNANIELVESDRKWCSVFLRFFASLFVFFASLFVLFFAVFVVALFLMLLFGQFEQTGMGLGIDFFCVMCRLRIAAARFAISEACLGFDDGGGLGVLVDFDRDSIHEQGQGG